METRLVVVGRIRSAHPPARFEIFLESDVAAVFERDSEVAL